MDCAPEIHELLNELVAGCERALPETLEAVYLHGSLATGDFDPAVSDLDLLIVVSEDIDDSQLETLTEMHRSFVEIHPIWDDRVDAAYLSSQALCTCKDRASPIVVISPGEAINRQQTTAGWLMNWYMVREHGITLVGPPPASIIVPISVDEFLSAVRAHMAEMPSRTAASRAASFHAYAVLTSCRALYACTQRKQVSKMRAAEWARETFPDRSPAIDIAWSLRSGGKKTSAERADFASVATEFARFAAHKVLL